MVAREGPDLAAQLGADALSAPGTLCASRVWSINARLNAAQLPTSGGIRFVPERGYDPNVPISGGPNRDTLTACGMSGSKVGRGRPVNCSNGTSSSVGRATASSAGPPVTART
jgi:hypothetical protein